MKDMSLFFKAVDFANKAHFNQRRKSSTDPYIVHPVRVGYLALDAGMSTNASAAAILHDVMEDCGVTREELEKEFNDEIALTVHLLTKWWSDDISAEEKSINMGNYYFNILSNSDAVNIKLLDRIDNLRDMLLLLPKQTRWVTKYLSKTEKEFVQLYQASDNQAIQVLFNGTLVLVKEKLAKQ